MSLQRIDVDTRETVAGVVRMLRRAAELVWLVLDIDGVGSPRQVLASSIDVAADEARNLLPHAISIEGLRRSRMNQPISYALPSSRGGASPSQRRDRAASPADAGGGPRVGSEHRVGG
jgi:hypothetical protein